MTLLCHTLHNFNIMYTLTIILQFVIRNKTIRTKTVPKSSRNQSQMIILSQIRLECVSDQQLNKEQRRVSEDKKVVLQMISECCYISCRHKVNNEGVLTSLISSNSDICFICRNKNMP